MIYSLDNEAVMSTSITAKPGDEKLFSFLYDCRDGYSITAATDNPDVTLTGKANVGDSYAALPIDTSPFAPDRKQFFFKIEVDESAADASSLVEIICKRS